MILPSRAFGQSVRWTISTPVAVGILKVAGVDVGETRVGGCQVQDHRRDNEFQGSNEMTGGEEGGMSRGLGRGGTRGERVDGRKGRERSKRIEREEKEEEEKQMSESRKKEMTDNNRNSNKPKGNEGSKQRNHLKWWWWWWVCGSGRGVWAGDAERAKA